MFVMEHIVALHRLRIIWPIYIQDVTHTNSHYVTYLCYCLFDGADLFCLI